MLSTQIVHESNIGSLTYDDEIRDCTIDEVCAVRVGDRVLVLPIGAELAAGSGFEVINIDTKYLTSIGVKPRAHGASAPQATQHDPTTALPSALHVADRNDTQIADHPADHSADVRAQRPIDAVPAESETEVVSSLSTLPSLQPLAGSPVEAPVGDASMNGLHTPPHLESDNTADRSKDPGIVEGWFGVTNPAVGSAGSADAGLTADPDAHSDADSDEAAAVGATNHPLHQEDGSLIGTLESQAAVVSETDRRSSTSWVNALQDTFVNAPSTPAAETMAGPATSTPTSDAAPVHSPIAAQLVDWSVLDAVVEPARPLDVASANRENGSGLAQVGWPEIDRRAPELLDTAPAAFNPFAKTTTTTTPSNRAGDQAASRDRAATGGVAQPKAEPSTTPSAPSTPPSTGEAAVVVSPTSVDAQRDAGFDTPEITSTPSVASTADPSNTRSTPDPSNSPSTPSTPIDGGLGSSAGTALSSAPKIGSALFASVVASQLVLRGSNPVADGYLGISFVLAPGEAMEIRGSDEAQVLQLFRTLAGFVAPESGSLDVDGEDRSALAPTERARREALFSGALFDAPVLIPERSAAANLEIPLRAAGIAPTTAAAMTASRIETMGLTVLGPHRLETLSGELRVLVGAARSLIMPSPLVVIAMDTRPLADETVKWLHALVDQARRGGAAIVYRSSDPRFGFDASRVAMLSNGVLAPVAHAA